MYGRLSAMWVPVYEDAVLRMERLEIIVEGFEGNGEAEGEGEEFGEFGLPLRCIRVLEVGHPSP